MTRAELIRQLVLASISDDFEHVDQVVLREVGERAARCGVEVERADVVGGLTELVATGMAKAYELSCQAPFERELPEMPSLDGVEEDFRTSFPITEKGLQAHLADPSWPFDDEGDLQNGWEGITA